MKDEATELVDFTIDASRLGCLFRHDHRHFYCAVAMETVGDAPSARHGGNVFRACDPNLARVLMDTFPDVLKKS